MKKQYFRTKSKVLSTILIFAIAFSCLAGTIPFISQTTASAVSGITSGAIYKLTAQCSGKVLNVSNSGLSNFTNVDQWTDTGSDAQRWIFEEQSDGYYKIISVSSGLALDVNDASASSGANIQVYQSNSSNAQKWSITSLGDGYYRLSAACAPDAAMDVSGSSVDEGTNVQQYTWNNSSAQKWKIEIQSAQEEAPTTSIADTAYNTFMSKFYSVSNGKGTISGAGFWGEAEMFEIIVDAYARSGYSTYKDYIGQFYNGFVNEHGTSWTWNEYNDDIMWMVIACCRAYLATGNTTYRDQAKTHFDAVYSRAWSSDLGGGLFWRTDNSGKTACVNGPGAIAACLLAQITGDSAYMTKAVNIYNWLRSTLYVADTGKVYDSISMSGEINTWSSTYNQGTFIGAAALLYQYYGTAQYLTDAVQAADYAKNTMFSGGVIGGESGSDLDGFKGIFARWMRELILDCNQTQYIEWMQLSAATAWNNRNSDGLIYTEWNKRTSETTAYSSFSYSTAVSLLQNCPIGTGVMDGTSRIEAENFSEIGGGISETCSEGTKNLGGILNGYYSAYKNIDFGSTTMRFVRLRLSCATSGGTIEIRKDGTNGTLLGTCTVTSTGSWSSWQTFTCQISGITGIQDIYLVCKGSGYVANVNWMEFAQGIDIYNDANYAGWQASFDVGSYTLSDITAAGGYDNQLSSVKVPSGYKVTLYDGDNFTGTSLTLTANTNYVGSDFNDKTTSLIVEKVS